MLQLVENPKKLGYLVKSTGIWQNQPSLCMDFPNTQEIPHIFSTVLANPAI